MRRHLPSTGLLVSLALLFCAALPSSAAASTFGTIEGTVIAPGAVEEVEVCVIEELPSETCTFPNPSGRYELSQLNPGSYFVEFLPSYQSHYARQYYNDKPSLKGAEKVPVRPLQTTHEINATLEVGGAIAGEVTDALTAAPLADVEVCAQEALGAALGGCAHTDASGHYTVTSLSPGPYKVGFWGERRSAAYLPQYYSEASSFSTGGSVSVEADTTTPAIDAQLQEGARIEGRVTAASGGAELPGIAVCAFEAGGGHPERCTFTDAGGDYTLPGLSTGSYTVVFSPEFKEFVAGELFTAEEDGYLTQYYEGEPTLAEANAVSLLAPQATAGIDAQLVGPPLPPPPPLSPPAPPSLPGGSTILPGPANPPPPAKKRVKCRRGFKVGKVKGKARCVRVQPAKPHH